MINIRIRSILLRLKLLFLFQFQRKNVTTLLTYKTLFFSRGVLVTLLEAQLLMNVLRVSPWEVAATWLVPKVVAGDQMEDSIQPARLMLNFSVRISLFGFLKLLLCYVILPWITKLCEWYYNVKIGALKWKAINIHLSEYFV